MQKGLAALVSLAGIPFLAGCYSVQAQAPSAVVPAVVAADALAPVFGPDGRLRRDLETGAPVFVTSAGDFASRAPRFNGDGTVARDPESGLPIYEDVSAGEVVRVVVATP